MSDFRVLNTTVHTKFIFKSCFCFILVKPTFLWRFFDKRKIVQISFYLILSKLTIAILSYWIIQSIQLKYNSYRNKKSFVIFFFWLLSFIRTGVSTLVLLIKLYRKFGPPSWTQRKNNTGSRHILSLVVTPLWLQSPWRFQLCAHRIRVHILCKHQRSQALARVEHVIESQLKSSVLYWFITVSCDLNFVKERDIYIGPIRQLLLWFLVLTPSSWSYRKIKI